MPKGQPCFTTDLEASGGRDEEGFWEQSGQEYAVSRVAMTEYVVMARILEAIEALPERQREAVELVCVKQYRPAEAAREMGISHPAFSRLLDKGVNKLRENRII